MRSVGAAILIFHEVCIAMVSCEENSVIIFKCCLYYLFDTGIYCFHRFDCSFPNTCMSNHVCIRIIETNEVGRFCIYFGNNFFCQFMRTHFRLKVIGGYFRRSGHDSSFPIKGKFTATVEKESDMRIFFRLGNPDLGLAM